MMWHPLPVVRFLDKNSIGRLSTPILRVSERIALRIGYGLSTVVGAAHCTFFVCLHRDHLLYGKNRSKVTISACFSR